MCRPDLFQNDVVFLFSEVRAVEDDLFRGRERVSWKRYSFIIMNVCMYVCVYVCMYVCIYIYMYAV